MVEFEYQPWKKIIIHEIIEYKVDDFAVQFHGRDQKDAPNIPIMWSNGVMFVITSFPQTPEVIKDQLKGVLHWPTLHMVRMPEYRQTIQMDRNVKISVINVSNHKIFGSMSKWLKENYL
jgi:hypothetical protein